MVARVRTGPATLPEDVAVFCQLRPTAGDNARLHAVQGDSAWLRLPMPLLNVAARLPVIHGSRATYPVAHGPRDVSVANYGRLAFLTATGGVDILRTIIELCSCE